MMKAYKVKEIFLSVQGEGYHAGRRAVFVRFAGCNVWSGREEDRKRDAAKGVCAHWCDTDFVGGDKLTATEIALDARRLWGDYPEPFVVLTGGEPSLQVDATLIASLKVFGATIAIETNGANPLPDGIDWITVSPKPPMLVHIERADEVKVIYPDVDPRPFAYLSPRRYVQPCDSRLGNYAQRAAEFVMANPSWRLSLQLHKIARVR